MPWPFSRSVTAVLDGERRESHSLPQTKFAFRLFHELTRADSPANVFFSPASVMMCLALVHELASGETREAMARTLEIVNFDHVRIENLMASMKSAFHSREATEISLANGVFLAPMHGFLLRCSPSWESCMTRN